MVTGHKTNFSTLDREGWGGGVFFYITTNGNVNEEEVQVSETWSRVQLPFCRKFVEVNVRFEIERDVECFLYAVG